MDDFKRVYLTVDEEVLDFLRLEKETVTAATLRKRLAVVVAAITQLPAKILTEVEEAVYNSILLNS